MAERQQSQSQQKKSTQPLELPRHKRVLFWLFTATVPFVLLLAVEIALRVIGYGPDLSLFATETLAGRTYLVMNPQVKSRYFPTVQFSPSTSPDYFLMPKPSGTYRIFCLGGSTTVGYPYWYNGAFSTFLRDRLRRVFPEKSIEIINLAMTATNSFTVNDMAQELVNYEPDLFIVYDGHNEFYGALGVGSNETVGKARWLTKLYLRAIHFRTFMLLRNSVTSVLGLVKSSSAEDAGGTMMERLARGQYIPIGSSTYNAGLSAFKANLQELTSMCVEHRVRVLLSSQVSNLRHLPPFISAASSNTPVERQNSFNRSFNRGMTEWMEGRIDSALTAFRQAMAFDSLRADVHYQVARCLDSLGRRRDALAAYVQARDLDQLRFRTSSDFNRAIKEACDRNTAIFVDIEHAFAARSPDSIVGNELIVEHLHPNSRGYFLMAQEYARAMRARALLAPAEEWQARDTLDEEALWAARSLTEVDERTAMRRTEILTSGWPFKPQFPTVNSVIPTDTLGQMAENITRARWNWMQAHTEAAGYYLRRREQAKAAKEYEVIINQLPLLDVETYHTLARLYLDQGEIQNARRTLEASLRVQPTILGYRALGDIAMSTKNPKDAIPLYEKTFAMSHSPQEKLENGYLLALSLARSDQPRKATTQLLEILHLRPDYQPAVELLAKLNSPKPK